MNEPRICPVCGRLAPFWTCRCWEAWNHTAWFITVALAILILALWSGLSLLFPPVPLP